MILEGILRSHMNRCLNERCSCQLIAESLDGMTAYNKLKRELE